MRIFLTAYTVRIEKKQSKPNKNDNHPPDYKKLNCFNDFDDFYSILISFLKHLHTNNTNNALKTYMKPTKGHSKERYVFGIIESGNYGISSNIRDIETDSVNYKKTKNDADVLPFYFLFYIPKERNEGVLILQRTGRFGIKTSLGNSLSKYFSEKYIGYSLEINSLIQDDLIRKLLNEGTIKRLRCVKYRAPTDAFDGLDEGHQEVPFNMEVVLSANKIPFSSRIKSFFDSERSVKSLIEIRDFEFAYDTVKLDVEVDGSIRTFDLGEIEKSRIYHDISKQVTVGADDQPTFESIYIASFEYLKDITNKLYPPSL